MPRQDHTPEPPLEQDECVSLLMARLRTAARATFEAVMEEELTHYLKALPYQRSENRNGQRNGHYRRQLGSGFGPVSLDVPRSRDGQYQRRQSQIDQAISAMFVHGVSTRDTSAIVAGCLDQSVSASTVSRVFHKLEAEYQAWRQAPLAAHYRYLYLDGGYVKVRYDDQAERIALLFAVGVRLTGEKELLAFTLGDAALISMVEHAVKEWLVTFATSDVARFSILRLYCGLYYGLSPARQELGLLGNVITG